MEPPDLQLLTSENYEKNKPLLLITSLFQLFCYNDKKLISTKAYQSVSLRFHSHQTEVIEVPKSQCVKQLLVFSCIKHLEQFLIHRIGNFIIGGEKQQI